MRKTLLAFLPFMVGAAVSACASAQAKGPDKPVLNVPAPPPHEIAIPAEPLEPVGEIPDTSPPGSPPAPRSRPTTTRPAASEKPEPKSDKPDQPAQPAATPPEPAPVVPPAAAPQLRTPATADTNASAKTVRTTMERAWNTLRTVNQGTLSKERQKAYKDAELFLQQAEDALKDGNVVFAQAVATKAETLAHELAGR